MSKPHLEDRNYFIVGPDDNIVLSSIEMNDTTKAYLEVQILHEAKEWIPSFIPPMDMSIEPDIETPGLFYIAPIRNNGEGHIGYFGIQEIHLINLQDYVKLDALVKLVKPMHLITMDYSCQIAGLTKTFRKLV